MNNTIEILREELRSKVFDQGFHWKILFIGTSVNGTTDIVSSLSRSLRNLGHHVLDIDTSRHRILDNPLRRQGGMGPIFVNYDKMESIVDNFEPQIIICCAGGLTFTEEDAQKLKDRGIVLVGITLSDPDVFPTIRDYQHVFDVHTTNAEIALDMYSDAGLNNTVYFPFGIDRGFVTQAIPENEAFNADVICLGHATNRPDRNNMMTALAKRFDVRTYGRGWEVPASVSVAGQEMVQALKGGKIHVNFPLTRAGYINIKCGVFESAGQGRLVATGKFDEMERFFTYGEDIIGYDDETDLSDQIAKLLGDPVEYHRIAENGFRRVTTEHLYEHRWMSLFEKLRTLDSGSAPWMTAKRLREVKETLQTSLPRAKKVIISGFYGARNLGDEMILRSISSRLLAADPAIQVFVAAENPTHVEAAHGLQAFDRRNHSFAAYQVKTAAAVILGGGGLWHDYTFERGGGLAALFTGGTISMAGFGILPLMGKVLDIPFHVVGLGVGPLSDPIAKKTVKYLANQAESIYVRDPESRNLLLDLPVAPEDVHVGPDSVYAVDLDHDVEVPADIQQLRSEGYTIVGLNLRPWANGNMDLVAGNVNKALTSLNERLEANGGKLAVVSLPMQAGDRMDRAAIWQAVRTLPRRIPVILQDKTKEFTLDRYLGTLQACSAMLSMRLHAALIAHRAGVPAVGLCYDPKVTRHFAEVARSEDGLTLEAGGEIIADRLSLAMESGMSPESRDLVQFLEGGAQNALDISVESIAALPDISHVFEVPSANEAPAKRQIQPPAQLGASFASVKQSFALLPEMEGAGLLGSSLGSLQLCMRTEQPLPGMMVEHRGLIKLRESKPMEIGFSLSSRYRNEKASGNLFIELEIDGFLFRQDLAETAEDVEIVLTSTGKTDIPFAFRLVAENTVFRARSWELATKVALNLVSSRAVPPTRKRSMLASSGDIKAVEVEA